MLWLERRAYAASRHVLTVSRVAREEIARDYDVRPERISVVYNGVDLERFHPRNRVTLGPAARDALGVPRDAPVCVGIGSGFRRKGFDLLLRLWREAPPPGMTLVLVGGDERLARWRREAAALDGRAVVTGPRDDVEAMLAAADVACVPSRQEAFGNVVLEACAAGVPVVTTRRAGAAELLGAPLDALVVDDAENVGAVAAALARALGPDAPALRAAARACAELHPWEEHLDRIETLLGEVAGGA